MVPLHKKQSLLLQKLLEENKPITSTQLSIIIGMSVRTIKTYIKEINEKIMPYGVSICSKARNGYWLEIKDNADLNQIYALIDKQTNTKYDETPKYNYERINYIIKKLLVVDYHIKMEDLMDEIYVSRSTLTCDLKEVRKLLSKFRLNLVTRANYGIIVEGNEIDKRLCISEYFFHYNQKANYTIDSENMFNTGRNKEEYETIVNIIQQVCEQYGIELSDFSLNNMAIHVSIAMRRCTFYNYTKVEEETITKFQNTVEYRAADALVKHLEKIFHCMLPVGEIIYYAMHLQSKRISDVSRLDIDEKRKLEECIHIILEEVKNNFELNLDQDKEFYQYLYVHIPQMIQRLKNHMIIRNPLVYDNLRRYLFATKVTHSAVAVIEQMYHVHVDINEFGYLLLYFNMAIIKFEHKKKTRIGFVSGRGRPESIMYFNEIQEYFSRDKYQVISIDKEMLKDIDKLSVDILVTTYTIKERVNVPVYLIHNDIYLDEIREEINQLQYKNLNFNKYFKEKYSVFDLPGQTKEEVLKNLYQLFYSRKYINRMPDKNTYFKDDELGNGIVHFQDLHRIVREEMCFIVVLKHPVLWNKDIVRVLIITKTKRDGDKDLPVICRLISRWSNKTENIEHLVTSKDFTKFLEDLKEN